MDGPGGASRNGQVWGRDLGCCGPSLRDREEGILPGRGGRGGGTGVLFESGGEESQVGEEVVLRAQLDLGQRRGDLSEQYILGY